MLEEDAAVAVFLDPAHRDHLDPMERTDLMASKDHPARTDPMDPQLLPLQESTGASNATMLPQDPLETQDQRDPPARPELQEKMPMEDHVDHQAHQDQLAPRDLQAHPDPREPQDLPVRPSRSQAQTDHLDLLDQLEPQDQTDHLDQMEMLDPTDHQDQLEMQAKMAQQERQDQPARMDLRESVELPVLATIAHHQELPQAIRRLIHTLQFAFLFSFWSLPRKMF